MVIALWGLGQERTLGVVEDELRRLSAHVLVIDQAAVLETELEITVGGDVHGSIRIRDRCVDLDEIAAVYVRPYDSHQIPIVAQAGAGSVAWQHASDVDDILWAWCEITPALVISRPDAMAENGSKPHQLEHIRRHGFSIPATLVTTDPGAARSFWEEHGTVIYKSVSGIRSIVSSLQLEHLTRLTDIANCPTQLQEFVPGVDHRIHVVGSEVFACEVRCEANDYRYPGTHEVELRACPIPAELESRCRKLAADMNLPVAGIDLRRSSEGEWYCFEVNPSPGFTYYEEATGLPIGAAIARLLASGTHGTVRSPRAQTPPGSSTVALWG